MTEQRSTGLLRHFSWANVGLTAGFLLGIWLMVGQFTGVEDIWSIFGEASNAWVLLAALAMVAIVLAQSWSLTGAVLAPMRIGQVFALQVANYFTGLIGGTVGRTATTIRFFRRQDLPATTAVTSGVLSSLAGFVCQIVLSLLCLPFIGDTFHLPETPDDVADLSPDAGTSSWIWILIVLVILAVAIGVVVAVPRWRSLLHAKLVPPIHAGWRDLRTLATQRGHLLRLFGGGLAAQLLAGLCLWASLKAFDVHVALPALLLIVTAAALFGGIAPVPGGMGVVEASLIAGLTTAGVEPDVATAATLTYRLVTAYLPPAFGYPALLWLRRWDLL